MAMRLGNEFLQCGPGSCDGRTTTYKKSLGEFECSFEYLRARDTVFDARSWHSSDASVKCARHGDRDPSPVQLNTTALHSEP